jgi:hypothetical protein
VPETRACSVCPKKFEVNPRAQHAKTCGLQCKRAADAEKKRVWRASLKFGTAPAELVDRVKNERVLAHDLGVALPPKSTRNTDARAERRALALRVARERGFSSIQGLLDHHGITRKAYDNAAERGNSGNKREHNGTGKTLSELLDDAGLLEAFKVDRKRSGPVGSDEEE